MLNRNVVMCVIMFLLGVFVGCYVTYNYFPKTLNTIKTIDRIVAQEKLVADTKTSFQYVQKATAEDPDLEYVKAKPVATVSVNGVLTPLEMVTNSKSHVEGGKLVVSETTDLKFDIKTKNDPLKNTLGIGKSNNGSAYMLEHRFDDKLGTWIFYDPKTKAGGLSVRF